MGLIQASLAFLATGLAISSLRPIAGRVGLLDLPGGRKTHINATPLVGGLGIFAGLLLSSLSVPQMLAEFSPLLILAALVLFIGVIDDIKDLKPSVRMTSHSLVALAMTVIADVEIVSFGDIIYIGEFSMGLFSVPVTVFATVGVINAINMSDGVDGLSGGLVLVSLTSLLILALAGGNFSLVNFLLLLICCVLSFLSLNFRRPWKRKALVYLGDAGSTMLGFMLAWLLIEASQGTEALFQPVYGLWFLAIPLFDAVNLLLKRPLRGDSPFRPGTDHLHHVLLSRGFSGGEVVFIILTISFLFALAGMLGFYYCANEAFMFQIFISLFILYFLTIDRLSVKQVPPNTY